MIIWITGASTGLGRELAAQYARAGHKVIVSARSSEGLESLRTEAGDMIHPLPLDITDAAGVRSAFERIVNEIGLPDLCVLNAGTHLKDSALDIDPAHHERIMQINYHGTINCLAAVIAGYKTRGSGHVAVVSSVAGYRGLPYASAYGATKAALINLCESLQPELAAAGIRLSVVNPGFVRTPLTDKNDFEMPFLMEVEDAARSLRQGLDSGRFEITFPKRFTWILKFLRILPIALYLRMTRNLLNADQGRSDSDS